MPVRFESSGNRGAMSLPSRSDSEITEQSADLFPQLFAMNDHIDQAVLFEKFSSLKTFGQILMRSFLDHAWTSEPDHASRFSYDDVAQRRETGHHACGGWICQDRNVRQTSLSMTSQRSAGFGHLHQA